MKRTAAAAKRHVPFRECVWRETGEDLQTYTDELRAAKPEMKPWSPPWYVFALILLAAIIAIAVQIRP